MYLTLATFSELWTTKYHMSVGIGSLNYLPLGIGFYVGAMVSNGALRGSGWFCAYRTSHRVIPLLKRLAQEFWIALIRR